VRTAPGVDAAGIVVGINRFDGHPRTQRADAAGRFRFDGLTPGEWRVEKVRAEIDPGDTSSIIDHRGIEADARQKLNCSVREGETTEFVLDLSQERPAFLLARWTVNGEPAAGWSLAVWPAGVDAFIGDLPGGLLDGRGAIRVEVEPGRYSLRLENDPLSSAVAEFEVELPAGETPVDLALETGGLEGRYLGDPTDLFAVWRARAGGGLTSRSYLRLDPQGRFGRPVLLAGPGELAIVRRGSREEDPPVAARSLELEPGTTTRVELP